MYIPYVRGRETSRKAQDIIEEVKEVVLSGYREVMLLGQNVNSYGKALDQDFTFVQLLKEIDKIEGLKRIRYITSHPRDMNNEIIEAVKTSNKIMPNFHLPLQAGNDEILRSMNRGYTCKDYLELIKRIKAQIPDYSISTDIIVGFPGETAEMFNDTLDILRTVKYDIVYGFMYSPRCGTLASNMKKQVPLFEKKRRLKKLISIQNSISFSINKTYTGKIVEVLIEGESKKNKNIWIGRTKGNKIVLWEYSGREKKGDIAQITINSAQTWLLRGKLNSILY